MSQSFFFPFFFFFGFPLHTFSLINPIFSLSTHHLPIKQTANVYTIIDFPIESKLLSIQQPILLSLSLSLSLSLLSPTYQKYGFSPHQKIQLPTFGFQTHQFNFLYIDFGSLFEVTKLQLELESLFEANFSFSSLQLLFFSVAIFMVCNLYWIFYSRVVNTMFLISLF